MCIICAMCILAISRIGPIDCIGIEWTAQTVSARRLAATICEIVGASVAIRIANNPIRQPIFE